MMLLSTSGRAPNQIRVRERFIEGENCYDEVDQGSSNHSKSATVREALIHCLDLGSKRRIKLIV